MHASLSVTAQRGGRLCGDWWCGGSSAKGGGGGSVGQGEERKRERGEELFAIVSYRL